MLFTAPRGALVDIFESSFFYYLHIVNINLPKKLKDFLYSQVLAKIQISDAASKCRMWALHNTCRNLVTRKKRATRPGHNLCLLVTQIRLPLTVFERLFSSQTFKMAI